MPGGVITDDEIRSDAISQRLLGTEEIMLFHHTDCGMLTFGHVDFRRQLQDDTGSSPSGQQRRSAISTKTLDSRSPASGPARSLRARIRYEGSCTASTAESSAMSANQARCCG